MACHGNEPLLRHQPWFSWFTRGRQDSSRGLPYRRGRFLYRKRRLPASCRSSVYGAAHRELRGNPVKSGYPFSRMFLFQGFPQSPFSLVYEPSGSYFGGGFPRSARGALREAFLPDLAGIRFLASSFPFTGVPEGGTFLRIQAAWGPGSLCLFRSSRPLRKEPSLGASCVPLMLSFT